MFAGASTCAGNLGEGVLGMESERLCALVVTRLLSFASAIWIARQEAMAPFIHRPASEPAFPAPPTSPFTSVAKANQFYKAIS